MATTASDRDGGTAPRRSRRQLLAGGAAGALGVIGLEALADASPAQATTGARALRGSPDSSSVTATSPVTKVSAGDASIHVSGPRTTPKIETGTLTDSGWTIATPANPIADGQLIRIRLIQDSTGGRTVSWDTGYDWGCTNGTSNTPPALSTTANVTDIVGFEYIAALSTWCFLCAPFPQGF